MDWQAQLRESANEAVVVAWRCDQDLLFSWHHAGRLNGLLSEVALAFREAAKEWEPRFRVCGAVRPPQCHCSDVPVPHHVHPPLS